MTVVTMGALPSTVMSCQKARANGLDGATPSPLRNREMTAESSQVRPVQTDRARMANEQARPTSESAIVKRPERAPAGRRRSSGEDKPRGYHAGYSSIIDCSISHSASVQSEQDSP